MTPKLFAQPSVLAYLFIDAYFGSQALELQTLI